MIRFEARARNIDIFSSQFQNNRRLMLDIGVPEKRIMTATPQLICTRFLPEYTNIPINIFEDPAKYLPESLEKTASTRK